MAIEFHCEHCNHLVRAPDDAGGRTGKCPHCQNATYIPRPAAVDDGELDLAPLDPRDEERNRRAAREAAAIQHRLLHERTAPGEPAKGAARGKPPTAPAPAANPKQLTSFIVNYIESMSSGQLGRAEELVRQLATQKSQVFSILDEMAQEDLSAYGLPSLPKPVLMGFLKQLRTKL